VKGRKSRPGEKRKVVRKGSKYSGKGGSNSDAPKKKNRGTESRGGGVNECRIQRGKKKPEIPKILRKKKNSKKRGGRGPGIPTQKGSGLRQRSRRRNGKKKKDDQKTEL